MVAEASAGEAFSCARLLNGGVRCWGSNDSGQVGYGGTMSTLLTASTQTGLTSAIALGSGNTHSCAVLFNDTVSCWGDNARNELGHPVTTINNAPGMVVGLSGASTFAGGNLHSCALLTDGTVRCWGDNEFGELGDGTTASERGVGPVLLGP
jgi:alpha-tubulin suppressor-like RCC1 family protein